MALRFIKKNLLFILLLLGFAIRISLMFTTYSFDINYFIAWGRDSAKYGFSGFYDRYSFQAGSYPSYPPLSLYIFNAISQLKDVIFNIFWNLNIKIPIFPSGIIPFLESPNFLAGLIKLPPIVADIGLAYLAFLFTGNKWTPALILLNPAFFYTSAVWGQYDSVALFFTVLSLYLLFYTQKKHILSFFFFALALLSKQSMIIFIPVFLTVLLKMRSTDKTILLFFLIPICVFFLFFLPFYQDGNILLFPFKTYFEKNIMASGLPFISNHSFNFWALVSQWKNIPDSNVLLKAVSYRVVGYVITFGLFLILTIAFVKQTLSKSSIIYFFFISSFVFFLFLTRIHERHFQPVLFFSLLLLFDVRGFSLVFFLLSLFHFANLYHNMLYPYAAIVDLIIRSRIVETIFILLGLFIFILAFMKFMGKGVFRIQNR